jgi:hypothetical protein
MTTTYAFEPSAGAAYLPVPRVPARADAPWPPADLVTALSPAAGSIVDTAAAVRQELADAIAALLSGRPGGDDWRAARQADRAAVLNNVNPNRARRPTAKHLADVMAGEPARYATALALASAVSERLDDLRERVARDGVLVAVDKRRADVDVQMADAAAEAAQSAAAGTKSAGYAALERFDALAGEQRRLTALRKWLTGETAAFDPSPPASVPTQVFRWQDDARTLLSGGDVDQLRAADRAGGGW